MKKLEKVTWIPSVNASPDEITIRSVRVVSSSL